MYGISHRLTKMILCSCGVAVLCAIGTHAATLPPDPNNAALLYYQAFLLRPEPNDAEKELVYNGMMDKTYEYLRGAEIEFDPNVEPRLRELEAKLRPSPARSSDMSPSEYLDYLDRSELFFLREEHERQERTRGVDPRRTIRDYIWSCRDAIELVQAASELPECDWGIRHSQGIAFRLSQLTEIRSLAFVLQTGVLIHAADGDYRAAFGRCLMMRRFAHQIGNDKYLLYCASKAMDRSALRCIQTILGCMEPDADTLEWLQRRLADEGHRLSSPARTLRMDFEYVLQSLRNNAEMLDNVRQAMRLKGQIKVQLKEEIKARLTGVPAQSAEDAESAPEGRSLTDEELVVLAAKPYADFLNASTGTMESDLSYQDKVSELERLSEDIENDFSDSSVAKLKMLTHPERVLALSVVMASPTELAGVYEMHVRHRAYLNAVMAGVEIHLVNARQGCLPEILPDNLPKDPFTGRDFKYETTEDGFSLSLSDKNIPGGRPRRPYEFKVP